MDLPQPGVFAEGMTRHQHVEWVIKLGVDVTAVREAITEARRAVTVLGGPNATWGFSSKLWPELAPGTAPADFRPFTEVVGSAATAPATQYDIWLWLAGCSAEQAQAIADLAIAELTEVAEVAARLACYQALDSRDPTGFIDGTENPLPDEAYEVAMYDDGTAANAGSVALVQKWVHDLTAFQRLRECAQEDVFGRTRVDSIQLDDDAQPPNSHVSRTTVLGSDGDERHIFRRNTPFANSDEVGTQFIGITNDPELMDLMIARMFGTASDGLSDALVKFSKPVTGSYYYVPSMNLLTRQFGDLAGPEGDDVAGDQGRSLGAQTPAARTSSRLAVGSLKLTGSGIPPD